MHGGLGLDFVYWFWLNIICCYVSLDKSIPLLLVFVVLGLVSSVPSQEIGGKNVSKMTYSVSSGT